MPAFGKSLTPSQTTALTYFLRTLRGNNLPAAQVPAMDLGTGGESVPRTNHGDPALDTRPTH